jgi:hypothetical protein
MIIRSSFKTTSPINNFVFSLRVLEATSIFFHHGKISTKTIWITDHARIRIQCFGSGIEENARKRGLAWPNPWKSTDDLLRYDGGGLNDVCILAFQFSSLEIVRFKPLPPDFQNLAFALFYFASFPPFFFNNARDCDFKFSTVP